MTTIYTTHPIFPDHDLPDHPEHAGRIRAVWRRLEEDGLTARMMAHTPWAISDGLILSVHSPAYLDLLRTLTDYQQTVHFDADTYATPNSLSIARLAAGAVVEAIDSVLSGKAANGLAAVRPPGHHAMPDHAMGFCLLGNIAIGARFAQRAHGLKRVLILDYDVHHGNGTEAMFYDDPSVYFISTHQYPLYPGSGALTDIGTGAGEGATLNIPIWRVWRCALSAPLQGSDRTEHPPFRTGADPRLCRF